MSRDAAVQAAESGWAVFPCRPGDKRPAVDHWEQRACADPARVARHWPSPRHNVGIACGPSRLVVVDLDTHGELPPGWAREPGIRDGADVLATLCERHRAKWPDTWAVTTPSGGAHLYFAAPPGAQIRNSTGRIGPLVDVRAAGGYVLAAGSSVGGHRYEAVTGSAVAELPGWLWLLADPPPLRAAGPLARTWGHSSASVLRRLQGLADAVAGAPEGKRNAVLFWAAATAAGLPGAAERELAEDALTRAARHAGLSARETERTIASAFRRGALA